MATLVSKRKIALIITVIAIFLVPSVIAIVLLQVMTGEPQSMADNNSSEPPPQFCTVDFINLDKINQISVFRSLQGHDYSDSHEHNLSMKHYFAAYSYVDLIEIYSPVKGTIAKIFQEQNGVGYQVQIQVADFPKYTVNIFHLNVTEGLAVGASVEAGQQIGTASAGQETDIAVWKNELFNDKLYSYFDVMTDGVFAHYQARGATDRSEFVRSAEVAQEMSKTYSFDSPPPLSEEWVTLNPS